MKVYIAHSSSLGLIKIGCSVNPRRRMRHLHFESGVSADLLAELRGGFDRESRLHRQFAEYQVGHEWFRPEGKLATFLAQYGCSHVVGRPINDHMVQCMMERYARRLKRERRNYRKKYGRKPSSTPI